MLYIEIKICLYFFFIFKLLTITILWLKNKLIEENNFFFSFFVRQCKETSDDFIPGRERKTLHER